MVKKGYMGFAEGFLGPRSPQHEGGQRQIDWVKLQKFIEDNKNKIASVSAGLAEDWSHTSGEVWNSEKGYIPQNETYVFGSSIWATPAAEITYKDGSEEMIECFVFGDDAHGYFNLESGEDVQ